MSRVFLAWTFLKFSGPLCLGLISGSQNSRFGYSESSLFGTAEKKLPEDTCYYSIHQNLDGEADHPYFDDGVVVDAAAVGVVVVDAVVAAAAVDDEGDVAAVCPQPGYHCVF